ncbi:MAG TPA: chemotaxis protein CheW [Myxococcales bacterium]|nr:chemotaxis protein CheW [Myxococcales bacterium]
MARGLDDFFYDPDEEGIDLPVPVHEDRALVAPADVDAIEQFLCFRVAGERYAVDIGAVHEIVRPPPITEVPRSPRAVLGVISLRGEALPVFDVLSLLGLGASGMERAAAARRIIVLDTADGLAGLVVDEVEQVVRLPRGEIEVPPAGLGARSAPLKGIGRTEGRLLAILDPVELLNGERWK